MLFDCCCVNLFFVLLCFVWRHENETNHFMPHNNNLCDIEIIMSNQSQSIINQSIINDNNNLAMIDTNHNGSSWSSSSSLNHHVCNNNNNSLITGSCPSNSSRSSLMLGSSSLTQPATSTTMEPDEENPMADLMSLYGLPSATSSSSLSQADQHLQSMLLMAAMHHQQQQQQSLASIPTNVASSSGLAMTPATELVNRQIQSNRLPSINLEGSSSINSAAYQHPILMMRMMMGNPSFLDHLTTPSAISTPNGSNQSQQNSIIMNGINSSQLELTTECKEAAEKNTTLMSPNIEEPSTTTTTIKSNKSSIKPKCTKRRNGTGKSRPSIKCYSINRRLVESTVSTTSKASNIDPDLSSDDRSTNPIYRCHLCPYTGNSKLHFNAHMNTHFDHRCPHCDYTSRTEGRLKRHIRDFHSETPPETWTGSEQLLDESLEGAELIFDPDGCMEMSAGGNGPNPARNRKYRCKQCGYVAMDKHDFWEHSKDHIKTDRMLACPKCNFVTEYKHHLEYHLRNHFGSKPFKCGKCNYSCVNKSMLNSHMKSHSNIYQYRCNDCTYATKYCHSLKLHLRKYKHQPATVLNLDGTPNPYPVIDVYGTRRGPRPKKSSLSYTTTTTTKSIRSKVIRKNIESNKCKLISQSKKDDKIKNIVAVNNVQCSSADLNNKTIESPKINKSHDSNDNDNDDNEQAQVTCLRCNYCSFQTESKPDFSNHLLNHVVKEKLSLLNNKRKQIKQQQQQRSVNVDNQTQSNENNDEKRIVNDLVLDLSKQEDSQDQSQMDTDQNDPLSSLLQNFLHHQQTEQSEQIDIRSKTTRQFVHKKRKGQARKLLVQSSPSHSLNTLGILSESESISLSSPSPSPSLSSSSSIDSYHTQSKEPDDDDDDDDEESIRSDDIVVDEHMIGSDDHNNIDDESKQSETSLMMNDLPLLTKTSSIDEQIQFLDLYHHHQQQQQQQNGTDIQHPLPPTPNKSPDDDDDDEKSAFNFDMKINDQKSECQNIGSSLSECDISQLKPALVAALNDSSNNNLLQTLLQLLSTSTNNVCSITPSSSSTMSSLSSSSSSSKMNDSKTLATIISKGVGSPTTSSSSSSTSSSSSKLPITSLPNTVTATRISSSLNGESSQSIDCVASCSTSNYEADTIANNLNSATAAAAAALALATTVSSAASTSTLNEPLTNVNSLITKMHSVTFLMQEILLEMWSIKK
ncbi:uncharacterized protein LOC113798823 isoform X1 [Dermatophagoides pteronyssinus]|uniref:uncharacterized protein LOC113798823 isoform X1 n=2 Tax=Dermatophagoides pteronyssinus TaxID=6956 RepID=UPI003F6630C0